MDEKEVVDSIGEVFDFYFKLGTHDTSLFYERNSVYQDLKNREHRICCVCGLRVLLSQDSSELKDGLDYKELLVVEDEELAEWMALMTDV